MTTLDDLLESNKRKKKNQKKRKMGNTTRVWSKGDLKRSTIMVVDDEED